MENDDTESVTQHLARRLLQVVAHKSALDRDALLEEVERLLGSSKLPREVLDEELDKCLQNGLLIKKDGRIKLGSQAAKILTRSLDGALQDEERLRKELSKPVEAYTSVKSKVEQAIQAIKETLVQAVWSSGLAAARILSGQKVEPSLELKHNSTLEDRLSEILGGRAVAVDVLTELLEVIRDSEPATRFMGSALRTVFSLQVLGIDPRVLELKKRYLSDRVIYVDTSIILGRFFDVAAGPGLEILFANIKNAGISLRVTSATCEEWKRVIQESGRGYGIVFEKFRRSGSGSWIHFMDTYLPAERFLESQGFGIEECPEGRPGDLRLTQITQQLEDCKKGKQANYGRFLRVDTLNHDVDDLCHVATQRQLVEPDAMGHRIWYLTADSCIAKCAPHMAWLPHELAAVATVNKGANSERAFVSLVVESLIPLGSDYEIDELLNQVLSSSGINVEGLSTQPPQDVERIVGQEVARHGRKSKTPAQKAPSSDKVAQVLSRAMRKMRLLEASVEDERRERIRVESELQQLASMPWWRRLFWKVPEHRKIPPER